MKIYKTTKDEMPFFSQLYTAGAEVMDVAAAVHCGQWQYQGWFQCTPEVQRAFDEFASAAMNAEAEDWDIAHSFGPIKFPRGQE